MIKCVIFSLFLILINIPSIMGEPLTPLLLSHDVSWWQWITHPWIHASGYHLLLDGSAFLMLWFMLPKGLWSRGFIFSASLLGSALGVILQGNLVPGQGYGGLSGVAHGLMAAWAVWLMLDSDDLIEKRVAGVAYMLVLAKSIWELVAGTVFFEWMHVGNVGIPLTGSHLGGVIGGSLFIVLCYALKLVKLQWRPSAQTSSSKTLLLNT